MADPDIQRTSIYFPVRRFRCGVQGVILNVVTFITGLNFRSNFHVTSFIVPLNFRLIFYPEFFSGWDDLIIIKSDLIGLTSSTSSRLAHQKLAIVSFYFTSIFNPVVGLGNESWHRNDALTKTHRGQIHVVIGHVPSKRSTDDPDTNKLSTSQGQNGMSGHTSDENSVALSARGTAGSWFDLPVFVS